MLCKDMQGVRAMGPKDRGGGALSECFVWQDRFIVHARQVFDARLLLELLETLLAWFRSWLLVAGIVPRRRRRRRRLSVWTFFLGLTNQT